MKEAPVLITGGAGFLGANLADRLAASGWPVLILDNLSRPGVETNLAWLRDRHGRRISAMIADVRDRHAVREAVDRAAAVFHFAAQVAVTSSIADPEHDFAVNLGGTFHVLDAARRRTEPPPVLFASTNKVYGGLRRLPLAEEADRYRPSGNGAGRFGVAEDQPLEFCSPYGCSKGAADQYVLDHARIYGLPATVFRMSCLFGPRQFGTEDQGWVAHFLISALAGEPITIYGDGKQVRDVLFVDDVVDAWLAAWKHIDRLAGRAFNVGGGPANAVSLRQLLDAIARRHGRAPQVSFAEWRAGDQLYYVSDIRRFAALTGWRPTVDAWTGIGRLEDWLRHHWTDIASLRRGAIDESRPAQPEMDVRGQHLFRMPGAAPPP